MRKGNISEPNEPLKVPKPRHLGVAVTVGLLLFILLIVGLTAFQFQNTVTVSGHLEPSKGLSKIYNRAAGNIVRVAVQEGQEVHKGQLLFVLDTSQSSSYSSNVQAAKINKLRKKKRILEEKLNTLQVRKQLEEEALQKKSAQLRRQITILKRQKRLLEDESEKLKKLYNKEQAMSKKHLLTAVQLGSAMTNYNASLLSVLQVSSSINKLKNEIKFAKGDMNITLSQIQTSMLDVKGVLMDVSNMIASVAAAETEAIRAPIDGVVGYLPYRYGESIGANMLMATVIPSGSELIAKVLLPSSAMGKVKIGDKVKIRYASFPYLKYGLFNGVVSSVALSPSADSETGVNLHTNGYSATIQLSGETLVRNTEKNQLLPGAKLQATIITGHASVLRMVFAPVFGLKAAVGS